MDSEGQYFIVDSNGEVIQSLEKGDRILRYKSKRYLQDTDKIKYRFVKLNIDYILDICDIAPIVFKLLPYINYTTNLLTYENYVYITPRNFAMAMNKSLSNIRKQFQILEKYEVIKKKRVSGNKYAYYYNPYIACRSTRVEVDTINLFYKSRYVRSDR